MKKTALLSALISSALCSTNAMAEVRLNGFATISMGISDQEASVNAYNKDVETMPDSLAALQFIYDINDKTNATVQMIARGSNDWQPEIEWAYLSYQTDQGTLIRAGRLRLPLYMYSDYLDVRYAQPFVRPNQEVYRTVPFTSHTGLDMVIPIRMGGSQLTFQPFMGTTTGVSYDNAFEVKNIFGANLSWEWEGLLLRTIYGENQLYSDDQPLIEDKHASFLGFGFNYALGNLFILGEWARREVDDRYPDIDAGYIATGYSFNSITPYIMYGISETQDDDERNGTPYAALNDRNNSMSIGLRWDFMPNVALKADITHYDDYLDGRVDNNGDKLDDANVFTLSLDTVF